jgi:threonine aldolase
LLRAVFRADPSAACELAYFLENGPVRDLVSVAAVYEKVVHALAEKEAHYVEAAIGARAAFGDIEPLCTRERQIGLVIALDQFLAASDNVVHELASIMSRTSAKPLEANACEAMLRVIIAQLGDQPRQGVN